MVSEKQEILWGLRIIIFSFVLTVVWSAYGLVYSADPDIIVNSWQILSSAFLAWGLAKRINWVRIVAMVFSAIAAGIGALGIVVFVAVFLRAMLNPSGWEVKALPINLLWETISAFALCAFALWEFLYLRFPRVKQQFQKYSTSASTV